MHHKSYGGAYGYQSFVLSSPAPKKKLWLRKEQEKPKVFYFGYVGQNNISATNSPYASCARRCAPLNRSRPAHKKFKNGIFSVRVASVYGF